MGTTQRKSPAFRFDRQSLHLRLLRREIRWTGDREKLPGWRRSLGDSAGAAEEYHQENRGAPYLTQPTHFVGRDPHLPALRLPLVCFFPAFLCFFPAFLCFF